MDYRKLQNIQNIVEDMYKPTSWVLSYNGVVNDSQIFHCEKMVHHFCEKLNNEAQFNDQINAPVTVIARGKKLSECSEEIIKVVEGFSEIYDFLKNISHFWKKIEQCPKDDLGQKILWSSSFKDVFLGRYDDHQDKNITHYMNLPFGPVA